MSFKYFVGLLAAASLAVGGPAVAQSQDNDRGEYEPGAAAAPVQPNAQPTDPSLPTNQVEEPAPVRADEEYYPVEQPAEPVAAQPDAPEAQVSASAETRASEAVSGTVGKDTVVSAAEGVFGRGAEGLAGLLEDILKKQGEPSAYITGSEAGGAVVVGLRYGKGTLHHQAEGDRKVYWTGPSLGFDFGGDANKVFVLVYNLNKGEDLFTRFGAAEGNAYMVGGFKASYLRKGNTVLIPVRTGVGVRLGVNAGYMKFTKKGTWVPF